MGVAAPGDCSFARRRPAPSAQARRVAAARLSGYCSGGGYKRSCSAGGSSYSGGGVGYVAVGTTVSARSTKLKITCLPVTPLRHAWSRTSTQRLSNCPDRQNRSASARTDLFD